MDVWERWVQLLPLMFNPGPKVTVDERLLPSVENAPSSNTSPVSQANTALKSGQPVMQKPAMHGIYRFTQANLQAASLKKKKKGKRVVLDMTT